MDDSQIWVYIDEQRADLADFLDTLSADQWETPRCVPGGPSARWPHTSPSRPRTGGS